MTSDDQQTNFHRPPFGTNIHSAQLLGVVNALRTGDPTVDLFIGMIAPIVLSFILQKLLPKLVDWITVWTKRQKKGSRTYRRTISCRYQVTSGIKVNLDGDDSYNIFLIKAIKLYVHSNCNLQLDNADVELISMDGVSNKNNGYPSSSRRQNDISTAGMLQSCEIVERPVQRLWHKVGVFAGHPVSIYMNDSLDVNSGQKKEGGGGGGNGNAQQNMEIQLKCYDGGTEPINAFVNTAYEWYNQEQQRLEQKDRYLFDLRPSVSSRHSNGGNPTFTQYKLGDEKTFDTLFSRQCRDLLQLVDQFQSKTGRYAIAGYPYKFGLLLTGVPGTGKTSLIKAMAHYTKRHIVNVPLSRISYNSEISDVFFNKSYVCPGAPNAIKLDFHQVIFVLEDVDASSDVVKRRSLQNGKKEVLEPNSVESSTPTTTQQQPNAFAAAASGSPTSRPGFIVQDELNLTGLLNVLDGCVETPGRMVIMSTNHPEMLDPALIRPGRIDRIIELGYMTSSDCMIMLEHYYQTGLTDEQKHRVEESITKNGAQVTPAEIEQFVMKEDNVDAFIVSLERRGQESSSSNLGTQPCSVSSSETSLADDIKAAGDKQEVVCESDKARRERVRLDLERKANADQELQQLLDLGLESGDY